MRLRACDHWTSSTLIGGKGIVGPSLLHTWNWGLVTIGLQALSLVEKGIVGPSLLHTTLEGPMNRWMQDIKSRRIPTWHQMDHISWSLRLLEKNHLLQVGLTRNREIMALRNLTIINLLCFIMCENSAWIEIHWNSIWLRAQSHTTSHYNWGPVTTLHDFGSALGRSLDTSFGLSQFFDRGSWLLSYPGPSDSHAGGSHGHVAP